MTLIIVSTNINPLQKEKRTWIVSSTKFAIKSM
jgi:hypothetical protein